MPVPHKTGTCRSGDVDIFYRRFGAPGKTPILMVHGLSFFSYDWIEVAADLAMDREVVAMDMRGFGDSGWSPKRDYAVPTMALDVVSLLDHLRWPRAALVGHSMGGRSVAYCAARNPGRIAGLALVDYAPDQAPAGSRRITDTVAAQPNVFESVEAAMRHFDIDPDSAAGQAKRARFEAYLRMAGGGLQLKRDLHFRNQMRAIKQTGKRPALGVDMWQALSDIRCPVLVLRGTDSDMFAAETVGKMAVALANMQFVEIDAGHNIATENPAALLAALRPFLSSLGDPFSAQRLKSGSRLQ